MKCPNCKRKNEWDAVYCNVCGTKLPDIEVSWFSRHRKLTIFIVLTVLFNVFVYKSFSNLLSSEEQLYEESVITGSGEDTIALINIDGIIIESSPAGSLDVFSSEYTSSRLIKKLLKEISLDKSVKGVLLRVNSPGGSAAASDQIYEEIKLFKERNNVPVVAYFADTAASGGYYVAMSADHIIANPANITGSIGVIISYLSFADFIERYGIQDVTYTSGEYKDLINQFETPTEGEEAIVNSIIDDVYNRFVDVVAGGRKLNRNQTLSLADGRIYSANQAVENGLIDSTGQLEDAFVVVKDLAGVEEATLRQFGKQGFWDLLFASTTLKLNLPFVNSVQPLPLSPGLNVMYLYR